MFFVKSLNLRLKVLLLSNASFIILLLGIAIGIRQPILQRFAWLEQEIMQKKLVRVADRFVQLVEMLDSSAKAETIWTEMYVYMEERHPTFYRDTYSFEGMAISIIDVFGMLDRKGNFIHLDWIDRRSQQLKPLPEPSRADLLRARQLISFPEDCNLALRDSRNLAIIPTTDKPLLVVSRPILTRDATGPHRGTFLMGLFIDGKFLTQLEKYNNLELELTPISSVKSSNRNLSNIATNISNIVQISPDIRVLDKEWIMGEIYL